MKLPIYIFLILFLGCFVYLFFGNSQSSKYHYIIQNKYKHKVLPKNMLGYRSPFIGVKIPVPTGYTGLWQAWHNNGNLQYVGQYLNGIRVGEHKQYHDSGKVESVIFYSNTGKTLSQNYYNETGKKIKILYQ